MQIAKADGRKAAGPVYINEVTRADIRGKVMSFWQMFFSVGSFFAYWVNYACSKNRSKLGEWDWKIVSQINTRVPVSENADCNVPLNRLSFSNSCSQ